MEGSHSPDTVVSWNLRFVTVEALKSTPWKRAKMAVPVGVFFGSNSGVCEGLARKLVGELRWRLKLAPQLLTLNRFVDPPSFSGYALLITSTFRQGSFPDNALDFWHNLQASNRSLGFQFSVFGRGSTGYPTYNAAGRKLHKRLLELGAKSFHDLGEQDALSPMQDESWYAWKEGVIKELADQLHIVEQPWRYTPNVHMTEVEYPRGQKLHLANPADDELFEARARVKSLASTDRHYYHVEFPDLKQKFEPGDHLVVWPENGDEEVKQFLQAVGLEARKDTYVEINGHHSATYDELARRYIGIGSRVQRELLKQLSHFAPTPLARQSALKLADNFREFAQAPRVLGSLLLKISDGQPWNIAPSFLLESLPYLSPRVYSISSNETPSIAILEEGVATSYLGKADGELVTVAIRSNPSFYLPRAGTPIVLICTGTGIAPFRAFCNGYSGSKYLFYGCRSPEEQLYRNEGWPDTTVFPAFSRWGAGMYVYEQLKRHSDLLWDLISGGAYIYICGDVRKLRLRSRETLIDIMADKLGSTERASKEFKSLKKQGRIKMDLY